MSGHTTAPWQAAEYARGRPGAKILAGGDAGHLRVVAEVYRDEDATLIAAAPDAVELLRDLLNAHEGAVNVSDDPFPDDLDRAREWLERIRAVLAKAEGRS